MIPGLKEFNETKDPKEILQYLQNDPDTQTLLLLVEQAYPVMEAESVKMTKDGQRWHEIDDWLNLASMYIYS